jgi:hypothetical protein
MLRVQFKSKRKLMFLKLDEEITVQENNKEQKKLLIIPEETEFEFNYIELRRNSAAST